MMIVMYVLDWSVVKCRVTPIAGRCCASATLNLKTHIEIAGIRQESVNARAIVSGDTTSGGGAVEIYAYFFLGLWYPGRL
jgi:hypothetical protein